MKKLALLGVFLLSTFVAAAEVAQLQLKGIAVHQRNAQTLQTLSKNAVLNLEPGDQVCVQQGNARLTVQLRVYALEARRTPCFELARPPSFWDSLVATCQDAGLCQKAAQQAFARPARSRSEEIIPAPSLLLPQNYNLKTLRLPNKNRPRRASGYSSTFIPKQTFLHLL